VLKGEAMRLFIEKIRRDAVGDYTLIGALISLVIFAIVVVIGRNMDPPFHAVPAASSGVSHP
jgi:Flp pilus assembly pilin Flp